MEEIDVREERCVQIAVPIGGKQRRPIDGCVTAIARFCDCKVWISRDDATPSYIFFGFEADTALASYLFTVIDRAMRTELSAFRIAPPRLGGVRLRRASKSFQQGIAARVADRLDEMHRQRDPSVAAQRSTGNGSYSRQAPGRRGCLPRNRDPPRVCRKTGPNTLERRLPTWADR
jgi:hypothetical protein